ncbi:MAG: Ig-like domain-containing protein [Clostridiales bacterium]|nr:Ig-like domain-containing protein [Clostridiales bacterium]
MQNKKSKYLLLLATLCTVATFGAFASCSDNDELSNSSSSSLPDGGYVEETPDVGVTITQGTVELEKYASETLSAVTQGVNGTVTWTSSDESVAVVNDGVVTAKKTGSVTITAKIGEYQDTCSVTVVEGDGTFAFSEIRDIQLAVGTSHTLDGTICYEGDVFPFAEATFEAETGKTLITVENGVVTAGTIIGNQTVTATAVTFDGKEVVQTFNVQVYELGSIETGILKNTLTLYDTDKFGGIFNSYALDGFTVTVNGEETTEYAMNYELQEGADVIELEDNGIVAVGLGTATIRVWFESASTAIYDTFITVEVKEFKRNKIEYLAETHDGYTFEFASVLDDGSVVLDTSLLPTPVENAKVEGLAINGNAVEYTKENGMLFFENAELGEIVLTVTTSEGTVEQDVIVSDAVIRTSGDYFRFMHDLAQGENCTITTTRRDATYAVLANDILTSKEYSINWENRATPTINSKTDGVFNGLGHIVEGFANLYGIFGYGYDSETKVVKDYTMKNVTYSGCWGAYDFWLFAWTLEDCTFENVNTAVSSPENTYFNDRYEKYKGALIAKTAKNVTFTNCNFHFDMSIGGDMNKKVRLFGENANVSGIQFINSSVSMKNGLIALNGEEDWKGNDCTYGEIGPFEGTSKTNLRAFGELNYPVLTSNTLTITDNVFSLTDFQTILRKQMPSETVSGKLTGLFFTNTGRSMPIAPSIKNKEDGTAKLSFVDRTRVPSECYLTVCTTEGVWGMMVKVAFADTNA